MNTIRGQSDGPLTATGRGEARQLGADLKRKGGLTCLYLSTAKRAKETASFIIQACPDTELEDPAPDILSWSLGELEGKPILEAQPKIASFVRYLPDVAVPGVSQNTGKRGESFDDFRWRALPYIGQQMAEWSRNKKIKLGIVTHHRVVRLLLAWVAGGMSPFMDIDCGEMARDYEAGHPTSVWLLAPTGPGKGWSMTPVPMASDAKLDGGVYVIRHASTALNSAGRSASGITGHSG